MAHETIDAAALDQLFREARTQNKWQDRPVPDAKLHELYDLLKYAPTSANASPALGLTVGTASFVLMIGISALEMLVAVIQAYVFALLTSVYLNDAENLH